MARLSRKERETIARERLLRLLDRHGVATMRIIEQKISDAGPFNQRINPHILTTVRNDLIDEGEVRRLQRAGTTWYHLAQDDASRRAQRLELLAGIYTRASAQAYTRRVGDALEIATYRALLAAECDFLGRFRDLDEHDDSTPYSKEEPPSHIGARALPGDLKLDFHYRHDTAGWAGLECKNIREWLYPNRRELRDLMLKAWSLDCVPVLIGRRIHPSTVFVFGKCGLIVHQHYNQLVPSADPNLTADLKHKDRMGFFDVRATNEPDARLQKFVAENLPKIMPEMRERWNAHSDLIERFAVDQDMTYQEFAGRVARRARGQNEDGFEPEPDPDDYPDF